MNRLTRFEPKYNCYVYNKGYAMGRKAKQKLGKIEDVLEEYDIDSAGQLKYYLSNYEEYRKGGKSNGN